MEPPVTPKPMPASSPNLPINHTDNLFGIVYITLTGVIDMIIPATGLWFWMRKSFSYLVKLAPLLWWALPTKNMACMIPENKRPVAQAWISEKTAQRHQVSHQGTQDPQAEAFILKKGYP
ncbi:hypothetical protein DSO57_1028949 [Entomophthora muscae]|uniref:Uncharacterized protein n=1 Tax=Entomophthora muscae TaxID=34485 RepID=A0ACC2RFZ4_9FUNG|nr:hypothetical protein DSO57_1028949 [Entomophthora muscae]